jgi:hypothetical protein
MLACPMAGADPHPAAIDGLRLGQDTQGGSVILSLADLARHGLICGVTGSGKTHTAKLIAEGLSSLGVPVLAVDAKGDFAGVSQVSGERRDCPAAPPPVILWDLNGRRGHRLAIPARSGSVRHPALSQLGHMRADGAGYVGVLDGVALIAPASAYALTICDLIHDLAGQPPIVSAPTRSLQLAILIEEAHLIFRHTDPAQHSVLAQALSKLADRGIAVVFVSPAPSDLPEALDAALGFRIQHSLWGPSEASLVRLKAWFQVDPQAGDLDPRGAVQGLAIGEALVALRGQPVRKVRIDQSATRDGPISAGERRALIAATSELLSPTVASRSRDRHLGASLRAQGRRSRPRRAPG